MKTVEENEQEAYIATTFEQYDFLTYGKWLKIQINGWPKNQASLVPKYKFTGNIMLYPLNPM